MTSSAALSHAYAATPAIGDRAGKNRSGSFSSVEIAVSIKLSSLDPVVLAIPRDKARQADRDRRARLEAEIAPRRSDIGIGRRNVAELHRQHLSDGLPAERPFERGDKVEQRFRMVVAQVVEPMLSGRGGRRFRSRD